MHINTQSHKNAYILNIINMKFIRAYWGDLDNFFRRHKDEIINISKVSKLNEVVYVWGLSNYNFIKSLGFECVLMSEKSTEYGNDYFFHSDKYMLHKLYAIKRGVQEYNEVIFLDWDCLQIKEIDVNFYKQLYKQNNDIQMPLYIFPKNFVDIIFNQWTNMPLKEKNYIQKQSSFIEKYHFDWGENYVTPNAGFVYCSNESIIDELINLNETLKIGIASEEMTFLHYTKNIVENLVGYIENYEPIVCNGKKEDHFNQKELNQYILQLIEKDIYFIHN